MFAEDDNSVINYTLLFSCILGAYRTLVDQSLYLLVQLVLERNGQLENDQVPRCAVHRHAKRNQLHHRLDDSELLLLQSSYQHVPVFGLHRRQVQLASTDMSSRESNWESAWPDSQRFCLGSPLPFSTGWWLFQHSSVGQNWVSDLFLVCEVYLVCETR